MTIYLDLLGTTKHKLDGTIPSNLLNLAIEKVKDNWETINYKYFNVEIHKLSLVIYCLPEKLDEAKETITRLGNASNREYFAYNRDNYQFDTKCRESRIKASKLSIHPESIGFWFPTEEVLWIDNTNQWLWFVQDKKVKSLVKKLVK